MDDAIARLMLAFVRVTLTAMLGVAALFAATYVALVVAS